jgi:hypothetical protein
MRHRNSSGFWGLLHGHSPTQHVACCICFFRLPEVLDDGAQHPHGIQPSKLHVPALKLKYEDITAA